MPSQASLRSQTAEIDAALVAVGFATLLGQATLLREILVGFFGNEIFLGISLMAWLVLTAVGSFIGGTVAARTSKARRLLFVLLLVAPLGFFASLGLTAFVRPREILPGETPSLLATLPRALGALAPVCLMGGALFTVGVRARLEAHEGNAPSEDAATRAYVAETLGAASAGILFHFLFGERLTSVLVLALAAAALVATAMPLALAPQTTFEGQPNGTWRALLWRGVLPLGAFLGVLGVGAVFAPPLTSALNAWRYPGREVLLSQPSRYGLLTVTRTEGQLSFHNDGVVLFTTEDDLEAEERVHLGMLLHPRPSTVLLIGGAFGGGIREVLRHRPVRVDYVELDPALDALARALAPAKEMQALLDPRVRAFLGDGRELLRRHSATYDLILMTLPEPKSALLSRYYSKECFEDAKRALAPGGILAVSVPAAESRLQGALARTNAVLWRTLGEVFGYRGVAPSHRALVWAADTPVVAEPNLLTARLRARGIATERVGPGWFADRLFPLNVDEYMEAITTAKGRPNSDLRPVAYMYGLIESVERADPRLAPRLLDMVESRWIPMALLAVFCLPALLLGPLRKARPGLALFSAGAAGMILEVIVLLGFQAVRGHLYLAIGGLSAAFMAGLAMGGVLGLRLAGRQQGLVVVLAALTVVSGMAPLALLGALRIPLLAGALFFALACLSGAATGAAFAPGVAAMTQRGTQRAASKAYALDLLGAALGALGATLLTVPVLGLIPSCAAATLLAGCALLANLRA